MAYGQRYGIQLTRKDELFDFLRVEVCEAAAAARAKAPVLTDGRILGIQPTLAATIRAASGDHLREIRGDTTALSMKSAVATRRLTPTDMTSANISRHQPTSTHGKRGPGISTTSKKGHGVREILPIRHCEWHGLALVKLTVRIQPGRCWDVR